MNVNILIILIKFINRKEDTESSRRNSGVIALDQNEQVQIL
jgi:hypothetical protein